jgi:hypothetical protein
MKNPINISGPWSVTEKWVEQGQEKTERYEVHIEQDGQSIKMKIEDVPSKVSGHFNDDNIVTMDSYSYEDQPGYTRVSGLELAFSEDGSSANHGNCAWEWWELMSDFDQNEAPYEEGKSDGVWKRGNLYVNSREDIIINLKTLEQYKNSTNPRIKEFYNALIKNGKCFAVYRTDQGSGFAPSKFIGYRNNTMEAHVPDVGKDGKKTNPVIDRILKYRLKYKATLEAEYKKFCREYCEREPSKKKRAYWDIVIDI